MSHGKPWTCGHCLPLHVFDFCCVESAAMSVYLAKPALAKPCGAKATLWKTERRGLRRMRSARPGKV